MVELCDSQGLIKTGYVVVIDGTMKSVMWQEVLKENVQLSLCKVRLNELNNSKHIQSTALGPPLNS